MTTKKTPELTPEERATYEWQMWVPGFGEEGQRKLKGASVLVSRCGGVGGAAAYFLAAAGIGKLVLAHAGNLKPSDLNRQILMTHDWLGKARVESAAKRLKELNPRLEIHAIGENITEENAAKLVGEADVIIDGAPLFEERYLMNREAIRQKKPLVECAMYDMDAQITSILPGKTPCVSCLYPEKPQAWKRQFPVFGAVAGIAGSLGAVEAIKIISGLGEPLYGKMLVANFSQMRFRTLNISRRKDCKICGLSQKSGVA